MKDVHSHIVKLNEMFSIKPQGVGRIEVAPTVEDHRMSSINASMVCDAVLATPPLDRTTIDRFLSREIAWPKTDGSEFRMVKKVELKTLEELGLITFQGGWLNICGMGGISGLENFHESMQPIALAYNTLKAINYGHEGFIRPHFRIDESSAKVLADDEFLRGFEFESGGYLLRESQEQRSCADLFSGYLWERLLLKFKSDSEKAFQFWHDRMVVYCDSFWKFQIVFFNEESREIFMDCAVNFFLKDDGLESSFTTIKNQISAVGFVHGKFVQQTIKMQINVSDQGEDLRGGGGETVVNTYPSLSEVIERNCQEEVVGGSLLDKWEWIHSHSRNVNIYEIYGFSEIIDTILSCDNQYKYRASRSDRVEKLLSGAMKKPGLLAMLLGITLESNLSFLSYLLARQDTSVVAMMALFNVPQRLSYLVHRQEYRDVEVAIWNCAVEIFNTCNFESFHDSDNKKVIELILGMAERSILSCSDYANKNMLWKLESYLSSLSYGNISSLLSHLLRGIVSPEVNPESWRFYLLFWLKKKSIRHYFPDSPSLETVLDDSISEFYLVYAQDGHHRIGRATTFFSDQPWELISSEAGILRIISAVDIGKVVKSLSFDSAQCHDIVNFLRVHFTVLFSLFSAREGGIKDSIGIELKKIICGTGFNTSSRYGIFQERYPGDETLIWENACDFIEQSDSRAFDEVMIALGNGVPVDHLLVLYQVLTENDRREKILKLIDESKIDRLSHNFTSIYALEDAMCLALNNQMLSLAGKLLCLGKALKDSSKFNDKWESYEYKIKLMSIYLDEALGHDDIFQSLNQVPNPFKARRDESYRDADRYRRMLLGALCSNSDPDKAIKIFDQLYKEAPVQVYADNRFSIKIIHNHSLGQSNSKGMYQLALDEWLGTNIDVDRPALLKTEQIYSLLSAWLELSDYDQIDLLWAKLAPSQRKSFIVSMKYVEAMKRAGKAKEAFSVYQGIEANWKNLSLEERNELEALGHSLRNNAKFQFEYNGLKFIQEVRKPTRQELKMAWLSIKDVPFDDLARIISRRSVLDDVTRDRFFAENIESVCRQLLKRKGNLIVKSGNKKNRSYRLTKEDLINDWFVSLYNQRMSYFGLSCREQERSGVSPSGKGPGEVDGYFYDQGGDGMAIFEAFRLAGLSRSIIDSHLNKIHGYDPNSNSPVVTLCYCYVSDFSGLGKRYEKHICKTQYTGFDQIDTTSHSIINDESKIESNFIFLTEKRFLSGKEITLFHVLLNLK